MDFFSYYLMYTDETLHLEPLMLRLRFRNLIELFSFAVLQLVFRTVGYSGADIRNLVNEAGIMSVSLFFVF